MTPTHLLADYTRRIAALLGSALAAEARTLEQASELIGTSFNAGGLLYIFGSGHSHIFAEEAFYRAGGAARVCPVLQPAHMLHEGAVRSTELERESGHAEHLLASYQLDGSRDCMLVVSNSGANALPVEVATWAKKRGLPVIAITSLDYSTAIDRPGPRLHEIADVVVDNHCPPGDALVELGALEHQLAAGRRPDVFISANMPGAAEHNADVVRELAPMVPHL